VEPRTSKLVKIAYACFLGAGLTSVFGLFVFSFLLNIFTSHHPSSAEGIADLFGWFVLLPLMLLTFGAQGLGIALSFLRWREWPLLILSVVSILVWTRGSLWPEFCQNVWRSGTCTETSYTLSGIVFMAFGLQYFLFRRFLLHHRRLLLVGLGASTAWVIFVLILNWNSFANAVNTQWSTDAADCVSAYPPAITLECRTRVYTAERTLRYILASVAAFPVGLLALGAVAALRNRQRKSNQGTEA